MGLVGGLFAKHFQDLEHLSLLGHLLNLPVRVVR